MGAFAEETSTDVQADKVKTTETTTTVEKTVEPVDEDKAE
jgi:hypothetical protein